MRAYDFFGTPTAEQLERTRRERVRSKFGEDALVRYLDLTKNGVQCGICGTHTVIVVKIDPWNLDHDHGTGQFRGVLCGVCNSKLGWMENHGQWTDSGWVSRAMAYLKSSSEY